MKKAGTAEEAITRYAEECKSAIGALKRELQKVRTGRASAGLLEGIHVDYYGAKTALPHLGQITAPEPRVLLVQIYDAKAVTACEKAIQSAGLGFNPSREGNTLRIIVPTLTEESRREIVKHIHKLGEEIKVSIRNHRREANEALKVLEKEGVLAKDDAKKAMDRVQKQTDQASADVDKLLQQKEAECMEV